MTDLTGRNGDVISGRTALMIGLGATITATLLMQIEGRNLGLDLLTSVNDLTSRTADVFLDIAIYASTVFAANANDNSKNEQHGDSGRALDKAQKQINELKEQLKDAVGKEKKKIQKKLKEFGKMPKEKTKAKIIQIEEKDNIFSCCKTPIES